MSRRRILTALLLAGLVLPAVAPLFVDAGLFPPRLRLAEAVLDGHDTGFDVLRAAQMARCLRSGHFSARWAPDLAWGYGVPLFMYYAPGPYYLAAAIHLVGFPVTAAVKLAHAIGFLLAALFAYLLGRDLWGRSAGFLLAALYTYAPYHLADVYVRSSLGESLAFVWPPLALWAAWRFAQERRPSHWLAGIAALACLIMTHNVAALILYPAIGIYFLVLWSSPRAAGCRGRLAAMLLGPVGITAYFWLPALAELAFLPGEFTSNQFHYGRHFVSPARLLDPRWGFEIAAPGASGGMSLQVGWVHALAWLLAAVLIGSAAARGRRWLLVSLACAPVAALLMLRASWPVWEALPPLQLVQLPWRFLLLVALTSSVAAASLGGRAGPAARRLALALTIATIVAALPYSHARTFPVERLVGVWEERTANAPPLGPTRRDLAVAGFDRAAFLELPHPLSTTSLQMEYLPRTVRALPPEPAREVFVAPEGCALDQVRLGTDLHFFDAVCEEDAVLEARLFHFPGWTVEVDKRPVDVGVHPDFGTMQIPLPAGAHRVKVLFGDTLLRRLAKLLSLVSLVGIAAVHHVGGRDGGTA